MTTRKNVGRKDQDHPTELRLLDAARDEFAQYGYAGARVERIVAEAQSNPRMLYHHFSGKSGLYLAVLEDGLKRLRQHELQVDFANEPPVEGLLKLYDFLNDHFRKNPGLIRLLTNENIEHAKFMRESKKIGEMSSPILDQITDLLSRGEALGVVRKNIDALTLYVQMVALSQFHISNMHTLSAIFSVDISTEEWREQHRTATREMLKMFLVTAG